MPEDPIPAASANDSPTNRANVMQVTEGAFGLGLNCCEQSNKLKVEAVMRLAVIALVAFAVLSAHAASGAGCPEGYEPCGTKSCCPKR